MGIKGSIVSPFSPQKALIYECFFGFMSNLSKLGIKPKSGV